MPLWHIYCRENAYSAEDKCALAMPITDIYVDVACPCSMQAWSFTSCRRTHSLSAERQRTIQIARTTVPERRLWWLERINTALNPFVRERGYRWELHIDQTPFDFWTIQGMKPTDPKSEAEKHWVKEDRPSAYT